MTGDAEPESLTLIIQVFDLSYSPGKFSLEILRKKSVSEFFFRMPSVL